MNTIKCGNKMKVIPIKMNVSLEREEADIVWTLLHNARGEQIQKFGNTQFTEKLLSMMNKFSFPDTSEITI
jgi:hypothetical protein